MKNTNISAGTIARTIVLIVALVNTLLTAFEKNPLPFSDDELYAFVFPVITVIVSLVAWWKNNSFTKKAIEADAILIESKTESEEE